jgi:antitoxin VapB
MSSPVDKHPKIEKKIRKPTRKSEIPKRGGSTGKESRSYSPILILFPWTIRVRPTRPSVTMSTAYQNDRGGLSRGSRRMSILIKNSKTEQKIRKLAKRTGETMTAAIDRAVDDRLAKLPPPPRKAGRVDRKRLAELLAYFRSLPRINEHLTDEEIIGYDEHGVPK